MQESQWNVFLRRLLDGTRSAIDLFASQYPAEEVSDFAYDAEPSAGYVLTCFNTAKGNRKHVRDWHDRMVEGRKKLQARKFEEGVAYDLTRHNRVVPYCHNTGYYSHQGFTDIFFPEWQEFAMSDDYPKHEDHENDYLENHVAYMFAQALDTLVEDGGFEKLRLASPTLIGFGFHDEEHCVVRMLRLPGE